MELNNKNGILWKTVRKKERFFSFFEKIDGIFKKIKKIFKNPLTLSGRVLYNRNIEVGQSGAKCSEVLKKFRDFVKKELRLPPKKRKFPPL